MAPEINDDDVYYINDNHDTYTALIDTYKIKTLYQSRMIISLTNDYKITIMKDRFGCVIGDTSLNQGIEKIAYLLTKAKYGNTMELFQEGMRQKLIEVINDVLENKNIVLKGTKNENSIQRESSRYGTRRNSILQRFISIFR